MFSQSLIFYISWKSRILREKGSKQIAVSFSGYRDITFYANPLHSKIGSRIGPCLFSLSTKYFSFFLSEKFVILQVLILFAFMVTGRCLLNLNWCMDYKTLNLIQLMEVLIKYPIFSVKKWKKWFFVISNVIESWNNIHEKEVTWCPNMYKTSCSGWCSSEIYSGPSNIWGVMLFRCRRTGLPSLALQKHTTNLHVCTVFSFD